MNETIPEQIEKVIKNHSKSSEALFTGLIAADEILHLLKEKYGKSSNVTALSALCFSLLVIVESEPELSSKEAQEEFFISFLGGCRDYKEMLQRAKIKWREANEMDKGGNQSSRGE